MTAVLQRHDKPAGGNDDKDRIDTVEHRRGARYCMANRLTDSPTAGVQKQNNRSRHSRSAAGNASVRKLGNELPAAAAATTATPNRKCDVPHWF